MHYHHELLQKLKFWQHSHGDAERLAAALLPSFGFSEIKPSHPKGGPDKGADIICKKQNIKYICAVSFPNGPKNFTTIKSKFDSDLKKAIAKRLKGFLFFTNQELTITQRQALCKNEKMTIEAIHLENVANCLSSPENYGLRLHFLNLKMTKEEQLAYIVTKEKQINQFLKLIETLSKQKDIPNPIETVVYPISMETTSWMLNNYKIHFCSNCGSGYKVVNESELFFVMTGIKIKCPRCHQEEYFRSFFEIT